MIAKANGHSHTGQDELVNRIADLDSKYWAARKERNREIRATYASGETSRMNPVPRGIALLDQGGDAVQHAPLAGQVRKVDNEDEFVSGKAHDGPLIADGMNDFPVAHFR